MKVRGLAIDGLPIGAFIRREVRRAVDAACPWHVEQQSLAWELKDFAARLYAKPPRPEWYRPPTSNDHLASVLRVLKLAMCPSCHDDATRPPCGRNTWHALAHEMVTRPSLGAREGEL